MLICDGKRCIKNAFLFVYPNKDIQICSIHYVREASKIIHNKRLLPQIRKTTYNLYKAGNREEFLKRLNEFKNLYQNKEPKFFKILTRTIDETLTFYNYPAKFHSLIKSTNLIERFLKD